MCQLMCYRPCKSANPEGVFHRSARRLPFDFGPKRAFVILCASGYWTVRVPHSPPIASCLGWRLHTRERRHIPLHVLKYVRSLIQMLREAAYCGFLHRRGDVAVDVHVHGRGDRRAPQALLHHFGVLSEFEQQGRVRMPQPLECDPGQSVDRHSSTLNVERPPSADFLWRTDRATFRLVCLHDSHSLGVHVEDARGSCLGRACRVAHDHVRGPPTTQPASSFGAGIRGRPFAGGHKLDGS